MGSEQGRQHAPHVAEVLRNLSVKHSSATSCNISRTPEERRQCSKKHSDYRAFAQAFGCLRYAALGQGHGLQLTAASCHASGLARPNSLRNSIDRLGFISLLHWGEDYGGWHQLSS
jgi:hypothetical protein